MENHIGLEDLPPKPPDINSSQANQSVIFKDKLLSNDSERNLSIYQPPSYLLPMAVDTIEEEGEKIPKDQEDKYTVPITREDKQRIFYPSIFSVIIKLQEKKFFTKSSKENRQIFRSQQRFFHLLILVKTTS